MGWKNILLFGSVNGGLMAILMILNVISSVTDDVDFALAMLSFLAVILIPPLSLKRAKPNEVSLVHLIPVSFLTFIIPVFGAVFGGPDMGPEWLVLIPIAAVGGAFWSLPFVGWSIYKGRYQDVGPGDKRMTESE
ncbi:MAG: hypothetical protein CL981_07155 [Euryarchaeota archaeon]|nr:hypothetical protein [Euryarchaeota archaeon]MBD18241.1 hypothetical protein [Euryarchaeota archaeon]|tara:strand:- start:2751 stop:3155 length:405 start_codon:yes stop_codon:yes gene_type:complete